MIIKVLGPDGMNCVRMESIARSVVEQLGADAEVERITDKKALKKYILPTTPGLVIDGDVVCAGRVPSVAEMTAWVVDALEREGWLFRKAA